MVVVVVVMVVVMVVVVLVMVVMVLMMVQTGPVYNNTALCPQNNKVREFIALF